MAECELQGRGWIDGEWSLICLTLDKQRVKRIALGQRPEMQNSRKEHVVANSNLPHTHCDFI